MTVRELVTRWGFEINDKPLKDMNQSVQNMKQSLTYVGAAVAGAAATMFGFAKMTANAADAAFDMSKSLGVNAEELQKLQFAAQLSGSSAEEMGTSLKFLSRNIGEAAGGSKQMQATFAQLGLTYKDTSGKMLSADVVFKKLADRMKTMPEGPERTALAMQLLGRSGNRMIQLLDEGSEGIDKLGQRAVDLGAVLSDDAISSGQAFNDALDEMQYALTGVRNMIGSALFPVIRPLVEQFTEFVRLNRVMISQRIGEFFKGLSKFIGTTVSFVRRLVNIVSAVVRVFGGFERVATALGIALAVFASGYILSSIGGLAVAVYGLAGAFTAANAAALLIPVLIGAAVVAVGLIIEDLIAFFSGEDSVTGVIVDKFKEAFSWLQAKFESMSGWVKTFAIILMTPFRMVANSIQTVLDLVSLVRGKMGVKEFASNTWARALNNFGSGTGSLSGALGLTPSTSPVESSSSQSQTNTLQAPITVNVGAGSDPSQVRDAVKGGVTDGWDSIMRGVQRSYSGAGGY